MMQDPTSAAAFQAIKPQFPEQEQHLKCPRCDSTNTKFCYYNNYNLSQPRHFCKSCRRYWTKGGALRNIPVGGGTRKNSKRSTSTTTDSTITSSSKRSTPSTSTAPTSVPGQSSPLQLPKLEPLAPVYPMAASGGDQMAQMIDVGGSFSSLLTANGHYGSLLESFHHGSGHAVFTLPNSIGNSGLEPPTSAPTPPQHAESFWNSGGDGGGAGNGSGWPDLSIYTPGSRFP